MMDVVAVSTVVTGAVVITGAVVTVVVTVTGAVVTGATVTVVAVVTGAVVTGATVCVGAGAVGAAVTTGATTVVVVTALGAAFVVTVVVAFVAGVTAAGVAAGAVAAGAVVVVLVAVAAGAVVVVLVAVAASAKWLAARKTTPKRLHNNLIDFIFFSKTLFKTFKGHANDHSPIVQPFDKKVYCCSSQSTLNSSNQADPAKAKGLLRPGSMTRSITWLTHPDAGKLKLSSKGRHSAVPVNN